LPDTYAQALAAVMKESGIQLPFSPFAESPTSCSVLVVSFPFLLSPWVFLLLLFWAFFSGTQGLMLALLFEPHLQPFFLSFFFFWYWDLN
jgi:hypothetical protein